MLLYAIEAFRTGPLHFDELAGLLPDYEARLVAEGFLARKRHSVHLDRGGCTGYVGGILCSDTALDDVLSYPAIAKTWRRIESLVSSSPERRLLEAGGTRDEEYAPGDDWKRITLVCDCMFGASSLRCFDTGRTIARYKARVKSETAELLWRWEAQYDAIYACWLSSGEYESWAGQQLRDPGSALNQLGRTVADRISAENKCEVHYHQHRTSS